MNTFSFEEAQKSAMKFFNNDELLVKVWLTKYALKNAKDEYLEESPKDRFETIASEIDRINTKYGDVNYTKEQILEVMLSGKVLPGGSALFGVGNKYSFSSLSNCFVVDDRGNDSYGSILRTDQEIVQIAKRRGGVGYDLSHIRPKGSKVSNAARTSTGIIPFMERFSNSTREVGQDGRRGALMLSIHVNHPEVMSFATVKDNDKKVTGANISVKFTDEFMEAVLCDGIHQLRYPVDIPKLNKMSMSEGIEYKFDDGVRKNVRARDIFNLVVKMNWRRAEPGTLFWDTIKNESPADCYPNYQTTSTNPCGEIPLSPYDSCRLLSVNLTKYIKNPYSKTSEFNTEEFKKDVQLAYNMMDNIIDLEIEKIQSIIKKIEQDPEDELTKAVELALWKNVLRTAEEGRRAGMSLIGHGDAFAMLGYKYGSVESLNFSRMVHELFARIVYSSSIIAGESRGVFKDFDEELEENNPFLIRIGMDGMPRRNIALLTIPPSGTLSLLLNNQSSGIEPVFLLMYERSVKVQPEEPFDYTDAVGDNWKVFKVFHPNFLVWAKENGISKEELENDFETYVEMSPYKGATANEIDPIAKVKLQGTIQKYIDHSISVTHNLPKEATEEEVSNLYLAAWEAGCKGCTIYRDGSRAGVLNADNSENMKLDKFEHVSAIPRPKEVSCDIYHPMISGEKYVVFVGLLEGKPYEVFALKKSEVTKLSATSGFLVKKKSGVYNLLNDDKEILVEDITSKFSSPDWEDRTRMISMLLRHRVSIDYVVEQLNKSNPDGSLVDVSKVIARQLKKYLKPVEVVSAPCPECGKEMTVEGGCPTCKHCGYAKCN